MYIKQITILFYEHWWNKEPIDCIDWPRPLNLFYRFMNRRANFSLRHLCPHFQGCTYETPWGGIHVLLSQFDITYLILVSQTDITKNCYIRINPELIWNFLNWHLWNFLLRFSLLWTGGLSNNQTGLFCNSAINWYFDFAGNNVAWWKTQCQDIPHPHILPTLHLSWGKLMISCSYRQFTIIVNYQVHNIKSAPSYHKS